MPAITTGVWRIGCGDRWLRNFGREIVVAPGKADRDTNMMWRLDFMDSDREDFTITNVQTNSHATADPPSEITITVGSQTKWTITPAGEGKYHIQWPGQNLHWTVQIHGGGPSPIILQELVGKPEQVWTFEWVGDR